MTVLNSNTGSQDCRIEITKDGVIIFNDYNQIKHSLIEKDGIINLDINLLHYYLLEPILGIGDPRYDNRIDFLAGFHGLKSIEEKVNSGQAEVGFALFATQVQNVISFADKKLNMPPKSTWFDPKPLDGLLAYDFE